ncbi:hypothetical protein ACFY19_15355 [Streptosporangium saharense]|uniref:hypothetical protein n=1 Tax=Streptosporangium saharense TaxID=1706840 RepID=UPI0036959A30
MIDDTPLTRPDDRFPIGLPGHVVPLSGEARTPGRPWGMDRGVVTVPPRPSADKHERPTKTTTQSKPTKNNIDGRVVPDAATVTVTD